MYHKWMSVSTTRWRYFTNPEFWQQKTSGSSGNPTSQGPCTRRAQSVIAGLFFYQSQMTHWLILLPCSALPAVFYLFSVCIAANEIDVPLPFLTDGFLSIALSGDFWGGSKAAFICATFMDWPCSSDLTSVGFCRSWCCSFSCSWIVSFMSSETGRDLGVLCDLSLIETPSPLSLAGFFSGWSVVDHGGQVDPPDARWVKSVIHLHVVVEMEKHLLLKTSKNQLNQLAAVSCNVMSVYLSVFHLSCYMTLLVFKYYIY